MTKAARELLKKALDLPEADRVRLARTLLESVSDASVRTERSDEHELSPEWRAELERRLAEEPTPGKPWVTGEQLIGELKRAQKRDDAARARGGKRARGA